MFATNGCQEISLQMLFLESNKNFRSIVTKYIYIYTRNEAHLNFREVYDFL